MEQLSTERLAKLLTLPAAGWNAGDQAAALKHQLAASLLPDLAAAPGARVESMSQILGRPGSPQSFGELFTTHAPPLELLELAKQWARQLRKDTTSPLFEGPATVLYYAAIAAALVRHGKRITSLSDQELREGFAWSAAQPGAEGLRTLFTEAMQGAVDRA